MNPAWKKKTLAIALMATSVAFAQTPEESKVQRATTIINLEDVLWRDRNKASMKLALQTLGDLKSKESVPLVIALLKHEDSEIRAAAAHLIAGMPTRECVVPVAEALAAGTGSADLRDILEILDDPAALPAIRRAVKQSKYGLCRTLGYLGDRDDFELLLGLLREHDVRDAINGLLLLVRRSNKPYEPWMGTNDQKADAKEKWLAWWEANKSDFRVLKTATETFKHPPDVAIVENSEPIADLGPGTVELPKGWVCRPRRGTDTTSGYLISGDGQFAISYDIGPMAGTMAQSMEKDEKEDVVASTKEKIGGLTALIVVFKANEKDGKRIIISFPEGGPANFFKRVRSDDQIEIVKKVVLSYKLKAPEAQK